MGAQQPRGISVPQGRCFQNDSPRAGKENRTIKGNPVYPGVDNSIGHSMLLFWAVKAVLTSTSHSDADVLRREILFVIKKDESFHGRLSKSSIFQGAEKRGHGNINLLVRQNRIQISLRSMEYHGFVSVQNGPACGVLSREAGWKNKESEVGRLSMGCSHVQTPPG